MGHQQGVRGPAGREGNPAGLEVVGVFIRHPLLVDLLAVDAVREALQMGRPVTQRGQHRARCDCAVVVDERALGALRSQHGKKHFVPVGDSDSDTIDVDLLGWRNHSSTVRGARVRMERCTCL